MQKGKDIIKEIVEIRTKDRETREGNEGVGRTQKEREKSSGAVTKCLGEAKGVMKGAVE